MRLTESKLRRIIRRAILERMGSPAGVSYEGTSELQLLRDAFDDQALRPEDVRHLTYRIGYGRGETIEIVDNVIHAGHPPVVVDTGAARIAGTTTLAILDMLEALGARRV